MLLINRAIRFFLLKYKIFIGYGLVVELNLQLLEINILFIITRFILIFLQFFIKTLMHNASLSYPYFKLIARFIFCFIFFIAWKNSFLCVSHKYRKVEGKKMGKYDCRHMQNSYLIVLNKSPAIL